MRKRRRNAKQERAGLIAVEAACNRLDLIWRDLLQEDVGVDGTIEIALGDFPTGKLVGVQVKSGPSYRRSETATSFRFYPDKDDWAYWRQLSIPLFLLIHDPDLDCVYWVDVSRHIEDRSDDPFGEPSIEFSKAKQVDSDFESYLRSRFDLAVYSDEQYEQLLAEMESLRHADGVGTAAVTISALDLFVEGLWGLCSKVQFHSSLLSDLIRKDVRNRHGAVPVSYTFDRAKLYPFFTRYFSILAKHHLATLDASDISESLYTKLEYPAFIAALTTNGRRFVKYLQDAGLESVHDNQFMSLSLQRHVQIEVFASFQLENGQANFGPFTDVLAIRFNAQLDYYHLEHLIRTSPTDQPARVASQNIYYHELCEYIANRFDDVPKDNLLFRYLDIPLSPLICWLERWNPHPEGIPSGELHGKSVTEVAGFNDELMATMSTAGTASVQEPAEPPFPIRRLANGELLPQSSGDRNSWSSGDTSVRRKTGGK